MARHIIFFLFFIASSSAFEPFTGKVIRDRVRVRLQPYLEGHVLREVDRNDLLIVTGETEDFYIIRPPSDIKAYVFRTFVLDNIVEGSRVNVRLGPDLDSQVIGQLNSGDTVQGEICSANPKWMEIAPPPCVQFFVSKDFVENIGDEHLMATLDKKRGEVNHLLNKTYSISQTEMLKSFEEIDLNPIVLNVNRVINDYREFPEHVKRAKDLLALVQDHYLELKAAYLEFKTKETSVEWQEKNSQLLAEVEEQRQRLRELEKMLEKKKEEPVVVTAPLKEVNKAWEPVELELYKQWKKENGSVSLEEYYSKQKDAAEALVGIVKPFEKNIRNKPGDYLLVNPITNTPVCYLYSTGVDLDTLVGQEVKMQGAKRPDHHFAFPAYFVLAVE